MQNYFVKYKEILCSKQYYLKLVIIVSSKSPVSNVYPIPLAFTVSVSIIAEYNKKLAHKQFFQFMKHLT